MIHNSLESRAFLLVIFILSVYLVCRYVLPFIAQWHEERNTRGIRDKIFLELRDMNSNLKDLTTNIKELLNKINERNG